MRKVELENAVEAWAFGSSQYVQAAVHNVQDYLSTSVAAGDSKYSLPRKATTPIKSTYRPELDVTPELYETEASHYQSLIGILRWMVERSTSLCDRSEAGDETLDSRH